MPVWSWILIWVALVVILLGVLAVCAWTLFTKFMALMAEVERASGVVDELQRRADEFERLAERPTPRPNAVVRGLAAVERERQALAAEREERKTARREARIAHAKMLVKSDPMQYAHVAKKK